MGFSNTDYTVGEDEGNVTVEVQLLSGTLGTSVFLSAVTLDGSAEGEENQAVYCTYNSMMISLFVNVLLYSIS